MLSPGRDADICYSLPAGTYALLCFIADSDGEAPHAIMGMHKVVTLQVGATEPVRSGPRVADLTPLAGAGAAAALTAAVAVLIIACSCALGSATPTALLVGTGRGV